MTGTSPGRPRRPTYSPAPFGHPDGASGNLQEVHSQFVDFSSNGAAGGLASRLDDRTIRVLVGKKGVGKTIYLRRYQASASDESALFASDRESSPPATEDIVRGRTRRTGSTSTSSTACGSSSSTGSPAHCATRPRSTCSSTPSTSISSARRCTG